MNKINKGKAEYKVLPETIDDFNSFGVKNFTKDEH